MAEAAKPVPATVKIDYRLDRAGQIAAIRLTGFAASSYTTIAIKHGESMFNEALDLAEIKSDGAASLSIPGAFSDVPTPHQLVAQALEYRDAAKKAEEAKAKAADDQKEADVRSLLRAYDSHGAMSLLTDAYRSSRDPRRLELRELRISDPRLKPIIKEAEELAEKLNAEAAAKYEAEKKQRESLASEGNAQLREWAEASGTPLLRARVKHGFAWTALARKEFTAAIIAAIGLDQHEDFTDADNEEYVSASIEECNEPTLEEMAAWEAVKNKIGDLPVTIELKRVAYKYEEGHDEYRSSDDDDDDDDDCRNVFVDRPELKVSITDQTDTVHIKYMSLIYRPISI